MSDAGPEVAPQDEPVDGSVDAPVDDGPAPDLVTIDEIRAAAATLGASPSGRRSSRSAAADRNQWLKAESPPADRRVQDPRRVRRGRGALAGRARPRPDHLLVGQPRAGRRAGGPAARRPGGDRDAVRRAGDQAGAGRGRRRRGRRRRARVRRAAARGRGARRGRAGSRSSRPTTTRGSSPARARSGWRSPRTCRGVAAVLVPIGGGGLASGVAAAIRALAPDARVIGVEPELAADAARVAGGGPHRRLAGGAREPDDRRRDAHAVDRPAELRPPPRPARRRRHRDRGSRSRRPSGSRPRRRGWSSSRRAR